MALLLDHGHSTAVLDTLTDMDAPEESKAVSQVLLRLASQHRYDVLADVRALMVQSHCKHQMAADLPSSVLYVEALTRECHDEVCWHGF